MHSKKVFDHNHRRFGTQDPVCCKGNGHRNSPLTSDVPVRQAGRYQNWKGGVLDPKPQAHSPTVISPQRVRVAVVGAGIAGAYAAWRLKEHDQTDQIALFGST